MSLAASRLAAVGLCQLGDVPPTCAASPLQRLAGPQPQTGLREDIQCFVDWHQEHYATTLMTA